MPSSTVLRWIPLLLHYPVVPQRLPFSDLLLLPRRTRLPTLLAAKTISVTTTPPPTSPSTTPPSPTPTSSSPSPSPSMASSPSSTTPSSATASRPRPLPPPATPSTPSGTQGKGKTYLWVADLLLFPAKSVLRTFDNGGRAFNSSATAECGKAFDSEQQRVFDNSGGNL
ncbi:vegetative cell wall protein gp1-like [Vigna radiata var. radiata]|uniref:Vegetative cell wall protein gp1-like n=1 Tax=Vigna radiata var. radiata TaxID=3916 RepID=A0A3Q0ELX8_VIGRR|nr:vegetative cell wall protein gp1-like [Vigna radiata var. radiata]